MVRLEIKARRGESLGRFRIEQCELREVEFNWKQVYMGRDPIQIIYNLKSNYTYCFRACRINCDGQESDWSDALVIKIKRFLIALP